MKNLLAIILFFFIYSNTNAQFVSSISITPLQPTTADTITIIIENTFPSGPCEGTITIPGGGPGQVTATSMHCMGMLSVICTDYDTLIYPPGYLAPSAYMFYYELQTGSGIPCTMNSFVNETATFSVSPSTDVNDLSFNKGFDVYPNPSSGNFKIKQMEGPAILKILTADGREIHSLSINKAENEINCTLNSGLYFLQIERNGSIHYSKIIVE